MCGRYVNVASDADLLAEFDAQAAVGDQLPPSWNVAPTDAVRVILQRPLAAADRTSGATGAASGDSVRQLRTARWGLVPSWSRDRKGAARMINARIETVTQKPAFSKAAGRRRCLIPAAGYYEWQATGRGKVPYFLRDTEHELLAMAGLYELWRDRTLADDDPARWLWTCTVITQQATDLLGEIHDRSPVVVPTELRTEWLNCADENLQTAARLLEQMPAPRLQPQVVSAAVGKVSNNGPELLEPIAASGESAQPSPLEGL